MSISAPEVLCLIFDAACAPRAPKCSAGNSEPTTDIDWETMIRPYQLVSVCRYWRAVGLKFGPMWAYVAVPSGAAHEHDAAIFLDHIDVLLARSGVALLVVDIRASLRGLDFRLDDDVVKAHIIAHGAFFERVFAGITRNVSRIRTLAVSIYHPPGRWPNRQASLAVEAVLKRLIVLLCCPLPSLKDLCVFTADSIIEAFSRVLGGTATPLLSHAPLLRSLVLTDFPVAHVFPDIGFPSLVRVDFCESDPVHEGYLLHVLSLAPNLQQLSLQLGDSLDQSPDSTLRPKSLPVTHLVMSGPGTIGIMDDIQLPRLSSLSLQDGRVSAFRFTDSMAQTLTTLEVPSDIYRSDICMVRQLRVLEEFIQDIMYSDYDEDCDALFDALCDAADPMWPRLRSVTLSNRRPVAGSRTGLLQLVQIRNERQQHGESVGARGSVALPLPIDEVTFDYLSVPIREATQLQALLGDRCTRTR